MIPVIFYGNFVKLSLKSKEKPPILKKQAVLHGTPGAIRTHGLWSRSGAM